MQVLQVKDRPWALLSSSFPMQFRLSSSLQKLFYKTSLLLFSCVSEMTSQTQLKDDTKSPCR